MGVDGPGSTSGSAEGAGTKRKLDDATTSVPTTASSSTAGDGQQSPQSPPKKKSLKLRLSLSGSGSKKVKDLDRDTSAQRPAQDLRPPPPPSLSFSQGRQQSTTAPAASQPTTTTTTSASVNNKKPLLSKSSSSSRRIKLSLPKTSSLSSTNKSTPPKPSTSDGGQKNDVGGGGEAADVVVKKQQRRTSIGSNKTVIANAFGINNVNTGAPRALANATIIPMTSPGLLVVGAGKNNLVPPRVVFDQTMVSVGYTPEQRSKNPHRGSSVKLVVGDMFDSTTTLRLHFPKLVPNMYLKRADVSNPRQQASQPQPVSASKDDSEESPPSSSAPIDGRPLPVSGEAKKTDETVRTKIEHDDPAAVIKSLATADDSILKDTKVEEIDTGKGVDAGAAQQEQSVKMEAEDVHMDDTHETSLQSFKNETGSSDNGETKDIPIIKEEKKHGTCVSESSSHQPGNEAEKQQNLSTVTVSDAKTDGTKTIPGKAPVSEMKATASIEHSNETKANMRVESLASPTRAHKVEKKPSLADRLIKAFGKRAAGASKLSATNNALTRTRHLPHLRPFAGMIPLSLTLPYPDDYIVRQAKYLREVKLREKAIVARQEDTESIEIEKEAAFLLGRPYTGPAESKIVIPPIPQPPRPPSITEMKKLDPAIFGRNAETRLYPLKDTKNDHLDPHCFHITQGRYFALECNHTFDVNWNGPNCLGFNGLSMTSSNSLAASGGSSVPLLSQPAVELLLANAKAEEAHFQKQKHEKKKKSTVPRASPERDQNGKFVSKVGQGRVGSPTSEKSADSSRQLTTAAST